MIGKIFKKPFNKVKVQLIAPGQQPVRFAADAG